MFPQTFLSLEDNSEVAEPGSHQGHPAAESRALATALPLQVRQNSVETDVEGQEEAPSSLQRIP